MDSRTVRQLTDAELQMLLAGEETDAPRLLLVEEAHRRAVRRDAEQRLAELYGGAPPVPHKGAPAADRAHGQPKPGPIRDPF